MYGGLCASVYCYHCTLLLHVMLRGRACVLYVLGMYARKVHKLRVLVSHCDHSLLLLGACVACVCACVCDGILLTSRLVAFMRASSSLQQRCVRTAHHGAVQLYVCDITTLTGTSYMRHTTTLH